VHGVPTIKDWQELYKKEHVSTLVVCKIGKQLDSETKEEMAAICLPPSQSTVVVLSDNEESNHIVEALDQGARGYLPMNMSVDVAVEVIRLVRAGGTFVPASSLVAAHRRAECSASKEDRSSAGMFSARQAAVVKALRRGKSNKQIAYELAMCESTVKVHVRNIMKKLNAKNRTEVAFMANDQFPERDEFPQR
jgi:DNA-binding NarL/FixJ family response regulator